jgi:ubiquinol-cytochrome c reductase cytochrome b subunit
MFPTFLKTWGQSAAVSVQWNKNPTLAFADSHIINYPTPLNINYLWSFGALAGLSLVVQILTGVFLAMHYTPELHLAFDSVEHIMRDVQNGWFIRYLHANGASMFFIVTYLHIFRGLYFGSYASPRGFIWCSGIIVFFLMMASAFMGYVLPWGQMSFWGATVITNLFSAVPYVGDAIVQWLWGGYSVDNATLNRFFSLHYMLPFIVVGIVIAHLTVLHAEGSNNPLGLNTQQTDFVTFYPYFYVKDLLAFFYFFIFCCLFLYFFPNLLGHSDNYLLANSLVTPTHIVPEWYFLPFYAILRSVPDKLGGVMTMIGAILILLLLPILHDSTRSGIFRPYFGILYWFLVADFILLGWVGQMPVETPYIEIGIFATSFYFQYFLFFVPVLAYLEERATQVVRRDRGYHIFRAVYEEIVVTDQVADTDPKGFYWSVMVGRGGMQAINRKQIATVLARLRRRKQAAQKKLLTLTDLHPTDLEPTGPKPADVTDLMIKKS